MMLASDLLLRDGRVRTRRRSGQRLSNTAQIHDDSLDTVAFAFDLGLKALHLVAVEGIGDILSGRSANSSHFSGGEGILTRRMLRVAIVAAKLEKISNINADGK